MGRACRGGLSIEAGGEYLAACFFSTSALTATQLESSSETIEGERLPGVMADACGGGCGRRVWEGVGGCGRMRAGEGSGW